MSRYVASGAVVLLAAACGEDPAPPTSGGLDTTSITVEVVELRVARDSVGTVVSFGLRIGGSEHDVMVPEDAASTPAEAEGGVAVLRTPLAVSGGGDDAPSQFVGRLVHGGERVTLPDAGAVPVADGSTAVRVCVDLLDPVPAAAHESRDGLVQLGAPDGPLPTSSVCSADTSIDD